jgi:hypothetical protein
MPEQMSCVCGEKKKCKSVAEKKDYCQRVKVKNIIMDEIIQ